MTGRNNPTPTNPNTMEGMEASSSIMVLMVAAIGRGATFAMKRAVKTPIGKDIRTVKKAMYNVFIIIKPAPYAVDRKVVPLNQTVSVRNWRTLADPNPLLSDIKGSIPRIVIKAAMITMKLEATNANIINKLPTIVSI
jgi:hypothetical protein